jgi:hypothetical protein
MATATAAASRRVALVAEHSAAKLWPARRQLLRLSMESADSGQRIVAGAWGQRYGRPAPSFWCRVLSSPAASKKQFLLLHADAAKFWAEHPLCHGVPLLSRGAQLRVGKQTALITVKPPPTAVPTLGWKKGHA